MIYRITCPVERSAAAVESLTGLEIIPVPFVVPASPKVRDREIACSMAHAKCLEQFLLSSDSHATILEDDAILSSHHDWLQFDQFDLFVPYANARKLIQPNLTIVRRIPTYGAVAYRVSRKFAENYVRALGCGATADHVHHKAARGMVIGSYSGNVVQHDNYCASMVDEVRRKRMLPKLPN